MPAWPGQAPALQHAFGYSGAALLRGGSLYTAGLFPRAVSVIRERFTGFLGFPWFPLARFLLNPCGMARPSPFPLPWGGSPSSARIRFSAAATSFLVGSEMLLPLQFSTQLRQPGMQSKGRATTGLPVAGSQSKTPAGQKLRHSRSRRHSWQLIVGNQGNRSLRLRGMDTRFSPNMTRNRTGSPSEAVNAAFLWAGRVLLFFHAAVRESPHSSRREYPPPRNGLD